MRRKKEKSSLSESSSQKSLANNICFIADYIASEADLDEARLDAIRQIVNRMKQVLPTTQRKNNAQQRRTIPIVGLLALVLALSSVVAAVAYCWDDVSLHLLFALRLLVLLVCSYKEEEEEEEILNESKSITRKTNYVFVFGLCNCNNNNNEKLTNWRDPTTWLPSPCLVHNPFYVVKSPISPTDCQLVTDFPFAFSNSLLFLC